MEYLMWLLEALAILAVLGGVIDLGLRRTADIVAATVAMFCGWAVFRFAPAALDYVHVDDDAAIVQFVNFMGELAGPLGLVLVALLGWEVFESLFSRFVVGWWGMSRPTPPAAPPPVADAPAPPPPATPSAPRQISQAIVLGCAAAFILLFSLEPAKRFFSRQWLPEKSPQLKLVQKARKLPGNPYHASLSPHFNITVPGDDMKPETRKTWENDVSKELEARKRDMKATKVEFVYHETRDTTSLDAVVIFMAVKKTDSSVSLGKRSIRLRKNLTPAGIEAFAKEYVELIDQRLMVLQKTGGSLTVSSTPTFPGPGGFTAPALPDDVPEVK